MVKDAVSVHGLEVGNPYTLEAFEQALGQPTRVIPSFELTQVAVRKTGQRETAVRVGETISQTAVISRFGEPQQMEEHADEAADGRIRTFTYPDFTLRTLDDTLYDFGIDNSAYEVIADGKYTLKTGDAVETLVRSLPQDAVRIRRFGNSVRIHFKIEDSDTFSDDSLILESDTHGKVTSIRWYSPV